MGALETVLAGIGLMAVIGGVVRWHLARSVEPPPEPDLAAPYREGLHAAMRMQVVAQDLEQQMYAEAIRRADSQPDGEP
jgi:hypothetical protein